MAVIKNKLFLRFVSLICLISIMHYDYAACAGTNKQNNNMKRFANEDIAPVSSSINLTGELTSVKKDSDKEVYLITDAHCVAEAQFSIVKLLSDLYFKKGVKSVYIEGCSGEQDFDYLRMYPLKEEKSDIFSKNVKKGVISGVEYFACNLPTQNEVKITGLEHPNLISRNREVIKNLSSCDGAKKDISVFQNKLLKWFKDNASYELNNVLNEFNNKKSNELVEAILIDYDLSGKSPDTEHFSELLEYFENIKKIKNINLSGVYSSFYKLAKDDSVLNNYPDEKIELRARLINLYFNPNEFRAGDEKFISIIEGNDDYADLKRYLDASLKLQKMDFALINSQIESFISSHLYSLCRTERQQHNLEVFYILSTINKLISLDFTITDTRQLMNEHIIDLLYLNVKNLSPEFQKECGVLLDRLTPSVYAAVNFYHLVLKRDKWLQDNFQNAYNSSESPCAVIVGGFHVEGFKKYFNENNINYKLLTPKIDHVSDVSKKVYYHHFLQEYTAPLASVYNSNYLATQPILSLSSSGLIGPPAVWYNNILGKLVAEIKPFPVLAQQWVSSISRSIVSSRNKFNKLIFVASLITMLGFSTTAMAQDTSKIIATVPTPTPMVQVVEPNQPGTVIIQNLGAQRSLIDINLTDETAYQQYLAELEKSTPQEYEDVIKQLFQSGEIKTILYIFENSNLLDIKEIIIRETLNLARYDVLARLYVIVDSQLSQTQTGVDSTQLHELAGMFDRYVVNEAEANTSFMADIKNIQDASTLQKLKYMLADYVQCTDGELQQRFAQIFVSILDESELDSIYYSYQPDIVQSTWNQKIVHVDQPNIFYHHSSVLIRDLVKQKMLENAFVINLDNLITKSQKKITVFIFQEEAAHATALYDLYQTGNPIFFQAAQSYFPEIFERLEKDLQNRQFENLQSIEFITAETYNRVVAGQTVLTTGLESGVNINSLQELSTWYELETYVLHGSDIAEREDILRSYYSTNITKLSEFFVEFDNQQKPSANYMKGIVLQLMEEAFSQDAQQYFDLQTYNMNIIESLIHLSHYQIDNGLLPSAWEYLTENIDSDYIIALAAETGQLEGVTLNQREVTDLERLLKVRFTQIKIQVKIDDVKSNPINGIFNDEIAKVARMMDEYERIENANAVDLDTVLNKYSNENEYNQWRDNLSSIVSQEYQRPTLITKVIKLSILPFTVLLIGGAVLFNLIRKYKIPMTSKDKQKKLPDNNSSKRNGIYIKELMLVKDICRRDARFISFEELQELDKAILKMKKELRFLVSYKELNNLFERLAVLYHSEDKFQSKEEKKFIKGIYVNVQAFSRKDTSIYSFFPQKNRRYSGEEPDTTRAFVKNMLKVVFFNTQIDKIITNLDKIIELEEFKKRYADIRFSIKLLRSTLLGTKAIFFIAISFAPFFVTQAMLLIIIMAVMFIMKGFDIALFYIFNQYNEQIRELFEMNLSRAAKFDNRIEFTAVAESIEKIEASRWAIISVMMTLLASICIVAVFSPWFLIPYIAFTMILFIIARSRIMKKTDLYSPMYDVIVKTMGPVFGLVLNALMEAFVMTNLLEALIKAAQATWIINPLKSFDELNRLNALMEEILTDRNVISESTWKSGLKNDKILPKYIDGFTFENLTSHIKNKADEPIINGLNMTIKSGEMVFINAVSGMGKSTLARLLAHYSKPEIGKTKLIYNGKTKEVSPYNITHAGLRNIFSYMKFKHFTGLSVSKMLKDNNKSEELFVNFVQDYLPNITDYMGQPIKSMSEDERRFVLLALYVFINDPEFLVLDDLIHKMDPKTINLVMHFLEELKNNHNTTVVLLDETVPDSYLSLFNQTYILSAGKLLPVEEKEKYQEWRDTDIKNVSLYEDETGIEFEMDKKKKDHKKEKQLPQTPPAELLPEVEALVETDPEAEPEPVHLTQPGQTVKTPDALSLWTGTISAREFFKSLHESLSFSSVSAFSDVEQIKNSIDAVRIIAKYISAFAGLNDKNDRVAMLNEYKKGNSAQQAACLILLDIIKTNHDWYQKPDEYFQLNHNLVNRIVNYFTTSNMKKYAGMKKLFNIMLIEDIEHQVLKSGYSKQRRYLVSLVADIAMNVDVFAREDIPHQMKIMKDYTSVSASDLETLTVSTVDLILSRCSGSIDKFNDLIHDPVVVTKSAMEVIRNSAKYSKLFTDDLESRQTELMKNVQAELSKRRYDMIEKMFADQFDDQVMIVLSACRLSIYEIWGIKKLFDKYDIDNDYFLDVIGSMSYREFRSRLFSLIDADLPVTFENLKLTEIVKDYSNISARYLLKRIRTLNNTPIRPNLHKLNRKAIAIIDQAA